MRVLAKPRLAKEARNTHAKTDGIHNGIRNESLARAYQPILLRWHSLATLCFKHPPRHGVIVHGLDFWIASQR